MTSWLARTLGRLPVRRWPRTPVTVTIAPGLCEDTKAAIIGAIAVVNAACPRPVLCLGAYSAGISVASTESQARDLKTTLCEHVERGHIESASVLLGGPSVNLAAVDPQKVAHALALALGATKVDGLAKLYR